MIQDSYSQLNAYVIPLLGLYSLLLITTNIPLIFITDFTLKRERVLVQCIAPYITNCDDYLTHQTIQCTSHTYVPLNGLLYILCHIINCLIYDTGNGFIHLSQVTGAGSVAERLTMVTFRS